jgi:putative ABC transport system permease protein
MATRVRAYDFTFTIAPALYLPYEFANQLGVMPEYLSRRSQHGSSLAELFGSDDGFVHLWAELEPERVPEYSAFLAQRASALHMPPRARSMVLPAQEFMAESVPISSGFYMFRACAFVALLACIVNLSRLLIVKYQARAPELAVQRALGATRRSVFAQHMLEALVVASAAVALALPLAALSLLGINGILPDRPADFALDLKGVLLVCSVGFGGGVLAGMVPALRMVSNAPAAFLRLQ